MGKKIGDMKELKEGKYVMVDDEPCRVTKITKSKPGKHGGAKARVDAVGIFDGQKRSLMGPISQKIEIPIIDKKTAQVLNIIGSSAQLMDMESYETFELDVPDEFKDKLEQGKELQYMDVLGRKKILNVS
ncbi:MAG: translation initiation factor IF-5A [Candidatus Altiarchaeota archaeon]|nr:translation initiation factor IF-5A [Candidatus Altiarchaeota archaeon]MBU4437376.1 translation initiation factor IF-5A [Candidatus Altiarchaeota archaeon]